jgi:hypothetical protein
MTVRNARSPDPWDRCFRNGCVRPLAAKEMINDD